MNQLLTHVVSNMTKRTEDAAVYALDYIISHSGAAKLALQDVLNLCVADIGELTGVTTQRVGEDGARPDLVVFGLHGEERVLIEAKFWAELTPNQPGAYLAQLPADADPSVLLVIAPEQRIESLWIELLQRIDGELPLANFAEHDGIKCMPVEGGPRYMLLTSWRLLLNRMLTRSIDAVDGIECDIRQLQALCERQDADAFLPIQPGEFAPAFPRRMRHLNRLIDDAVRQAIELGIVNTGNLRTAPSRQGYGRYLKIGNANDNRWAGAWFGVKFNLWSDCQETPIWLEFSHWEGVLTLEELHQIFGDEIWGADTHSVPVHLSTGVERERVLADIVELLTELANQIAI